MESRLMSWANWCRKKYATYHCHAFSANFQE